MLRVVDNLVEEVELAGSVGEVVGVGSEPEMMTNVVVELDVAAKEEGSPGRALAHPGGVGVKLLGAELVEGEGVVDDLGMSAEPVGERLDLGRGSLGVPKNVGEGVAERTRRRRRRVVKRDLAIVDRLSSDDGDANIERKGSI